MIGLFIPTVNSKGETRKLLSACLGSFYYPGRYEILTDDSGEGLSKKWNDALLWSASRGHEFLICANSDTETNEETAEKIVTRFRESKDRFFLLSADQVKSYDAMKLWEPVDIVVEDWFNWSWWVADPKKWQEQNIWFDENFGQGAWQDKDIEQRIKSLGLRIGRYAGACVYHHSDATRKHSAIKKLNKLNEKNKLYYEYKWGTA